MFAIDPPPRPKEERRVLEGEMRDVNEVGTKLFGAFDSREKTMAILRDRW